MKYDKKKVVKCLTIFRAMGFEVIKSNYGQTALNTVNNDMPMVLNNDVGYMTPLPYKWEFIDDEIKRLQAELLEEQERKAVLMAIHPKWCEKIFSGEKTIEVRKVAPRLKPPFKVYMYETQGATETPRVDEDGHFIWKGIGKVVGEFVCYEKCDIRFTGAALHITSPKRYDTPKELSEFRKPDVWYKTETDNTSVLVHETGETITRPPQSWMYVEEIEE